MSGHRTANDKRWKNPETINSRPLPPPQLNSPTLNKVEMVPSQSSAEDKLSKIKSEPHLVRQSGLSQEKRVRLRDYLFTARSSLQKNRELKKQMKNKIVEKDDLKKSIDNLKKNKYLISNYEMHKIVKKEIETELHDIISNLREDLKFIETQDLNQVSADDLAYFYQIRKIVKEKIRPSINQMKEASVTRQKILFQQMFTIGKGLAGTNQESIKLSQNLKSIGDSPPNLGRNPIKIEAHNEKHLETKKNKPIDLIQSLVMGKQ